MAERERLVVHFSGHVQGVGFRFTTLDIAERFPEITGCVRNLPDGRVELVAEGPSDRTRAFVAAVAAAMDRCIHSVNQVRRPATDEFTRFTIAR